MGLSFCISRMLHESLLVISHYSFHYFTLTYCINVWDNAYTVLLNLLIKCQKRSVCIVHGAGKYDHTYPIYLGLQIPYMTKIV